MYVIANATPQQYGTPAIWDEVLEQVNPDEFRAGDIVGIGIQTLNAHRGYQVGRMARERGATVIYGGFHASLFPEEPIERGGAHSVVGGEADVVWPEVLSDWAKGRLKPYYGAGRIRGDEFVPARWDLAPRDKYIWASLQTMRGCPNHCSFCSVWRVDGKKGRVRPPEAVYREMVDLRRRGFRFIFLTDDNFYPASLRELELARKNNAALLSELEEIRARRLELMRLMARLPGDLVFFTEITLEAAWDDEFMQAMNRARIRGAGIGIETVDEAGLKTIYKEFNPSGRKLVETLRKFREYDVSVFGSFMFGLPSDTAETFAKTAAVAREGRVAFAQFSLWTPLPGSVDFDRWAKDQAGVKVAGIPITKYWLIPFEQRPKVYMPHPTMTPEQMLDHLEKTWGRFYSLPAIWDRAHAAKRMRSRLAFVLASKLLRQMYVRPNLAQNRSGQRQAKRLARYLARPCQRLFRAREMPELMY